MVLIRRVSASDQVNGRRFADLSLSLAGLLEDDSLRKHLQGKMLQVSCSREELTRVAD